MDNIKKRIPKEFAAMERHMGRMMRNMSLSQMMVSHSGNWPPATDVYESENEIIVYMDVSGVDPEKLTVTAELMSVTVTGERKFPVVDMCCIHQLEVEYGRFERSVTLPVPIDVSSTNSVCKNGFLIINMPKKKHKGKVQIKLS